MADVEEASRERDACCTMVCIECPFNWKKLLKTEEKVIDVTRSSHAPLLLPPPSPTRLSRPNVIAYQPNTTRLDAHRPRPTAPASGSTSKQPRSLLVLTRRDSSNLHSCPQLNNASALLSPPHQRAPPYTRLYPSPSPIPRAHSDLLPFDIHRRIRRASIFYTEPGPTPDNGAQATRDLAIQHTRNPYL
ncbi:hypothetical protein B0H16DRAFT_1524544 [Mycena metata]|uniref:Uncharacterized protein n=1 Tax=Mycena metata TaxID=1033252 RepID=A0AAD7JHV2_9AGAR|nr:hypothetical protein B0H16DRAFT_1642297 [Mycena metata]KAJ7765168.1 hypothetical protein B0H16DRAFT_1524544 [Mycena metata]